MISRNYVTLRFFKKFQKLRNSSLAWNGRYRRNELEGLSNYALIYSSKFIFNEVSEKYGNYRFFIQADRNGKGVDFLCLSRADKMPAAKLCNIKTATARHAAFLMIRRIP